MYLGMKLQVRGSVLDDHYVNGQRAGRGIILIPRRGVQFIVHIDMLSVMSMASLSAVFNLYYCICLRVSKTTLVLRTFVCLFQCRLVVQ